MLAAVHFDWVDLALVILVLGAALHGVRLGAAIQVMSFGGFWVGLLIGAALAPLAAGAVHSATAKAAVSLVVLFGSATILGGVGRHLGVRLWRVLHRVRLAAADAGLGAVIASAATLFAAWLIASILIAAPSPAVAGQIGNSAIIRGLDRILPGAPQVFSRIDSLINTSSFPLPFSGLPPQLTPPVALPASPEVQAAARVAEPSMVKVTGYACGDIQEGSGFVVAPHLVVTNAHVVAGVSNPYVYAGDGNRDDAVTVYFNPRFDVAVLRVPALQEPSLPLDASLVGRGAQGAVLGYPENSSLTVVAAGVRASFVAVGPDIYGQGSTRRQLYELQAVIRPGNSGGPLVSPSGAVLGVVFSRSTTDADVGYALASPGVLSRVRQAEGDTVAIATGACIS
jgi:S1-C subfamily serine protease